MSLHQPRPGAAWAPPRISLTSGLFALLSIGVALGGCYSRVALPTKSTPPAAKIYVAFDVDPELADQAVMSQKAADARLAESQAQLDEVKAMIDDDDDYVEGEDNSPKLRRPGEEGLDVASPELDAESLQVGFDSTVRQVGVTLRSDLLKRRIGFPVTDSEAEADLRLTGTLAMGSMGPVLNWELTDIRTGTLVATGIAESAFLNHEALADQILVELMAINVDQYAKSNARPLDPASSPPTADATLPQSATPGAKAFAVIVGIEQYRDDLVAATHAEDDARAFAKLVETTLNVPPEHIRLLLGERAGRADIASAIEEWLPRNVVDKDAVVYVFFSGHGAPDVETGDAYLVPYDADPAFLKTRGYAIKSLYDQLASLPAARTLVFLDACFSGSGTRSVLAAGTRPLVPVKNVAAPRGVIAFSAAAAEQATGAADNAPHGLFTYHLINSLTGAADADSNRDVTLAEVVDHVSTQVTRQARLQNRDQNPSLLTPTGLDPAKVTLVQSLR